MNIVIDEVLKSAAEIRYVALYLQGEMTSMTKPSLNNPSASESDKYEELIVNPTLLKLVQQRGNIDCGGAQFVVIRYGHFFELVRALKDGHISVGIELNGNPLEIEKRVDAILNAHGLL